MIAPPAAATYQELWRLIADSWGRRTLRLAPSERAEDAFHLAFMGLSEQHIDAWSVIDNRGFAPQALIDDLNRFIETWIRPVAV